MISSNNGNTDVPKVQGPTYNLSKLHYDAIMAMYSIVEALVSGDIPNKPGASETTYVRLANFRGSQFQLERWPSGKMSIRVVDFFDRLEDIGLITKSDVNSYQSAIKTFEAGKLHEGAKLTIVEWLMAKCQPTSKVKRYWA